MLFNSLILLNIFVIQFLVDFMVIVLEKKINEKLIILFKEFKLGFEENSLYHLFIIYVHQSYWDDEFRNVMLSI